MAKGDLGTKFWVAIIIGFIVLVDPMGWNILGRITGGEAPPVTPPVTPPTLNLPESYTEDVTITFSSWNMYAKGTEATSGHDHVILSLNGLEGVNVSEDGTKTSSPKEAYSVMLGGVTTGGTYYPEYKTGTVPDRGTYTISGGLCQIDTALSFTYWNEDATSNTAQAMGASTTYTLPIRVKVANDKCFGNPSIDIDNMACISYNSTVISKTELNGQSPVSAPTFYAANRSASVVRSACYKFDKLADNAEFRGDLVVTTASTAPETSSSGGGIVLRFIDSSVDYDADTYAIVKGYEDEDFNDIGDTTTQTKEILYS